MKEESTGKCSRQVEHIRGHLWNKYSITVNEVIKPLGQYEPNFAGMPNGWSSKNDVVDRKYT